MAHADPLLHRPAHHKADGAFRNPPGSPRRGPRPPAMWRFYLRMARLRFEKPPIPASHVRSQAAALDAFHAAAATATDSLTWLGHAAFLIRTGGQTILTDPFLTDIAGPGALGPKRFVDAAIPIDRLPPIDILVISHNHYDHLDDKTIRRLPGKTRMSVVVPLGLADFFHVRGYPHVIELDWYQYIHLGTAHELGGVRLTALPCVHWSRRIGQDYNTTLWASFSLASKTRKIYFGGDSGYGSVFKEIGEHHGPFDAAILGIGAYAPREMMRASHATPEEAVQMGIDLHARHIVAMHWGTIALTLEPPFEPPHRFVREGRVRGLDEDMLWVMSIGETRALPAARPWPANE